MSFTVAIIGRPNVGKSTLFNRLVGKRLAIVDDQPGVTRDRREGEARLSDLKFTIIDTAGLEEANDGSLEARMRAQTERAVTDADVSLMLIDARAGVTPMDEHFAGWLRAQNGQVILLANKCEGKAAESGLYEAYGLGLGDPVPFSAEHGQGLGELYDALRPYADLEAEQRAWEQEQAEKAAASIDLESAEASEANDIDDDLLPDTTSDTEILQLAIVGRPNVGKSTLVNKLIGEDRLLTGPEAGITRDSISVTWKAIWKEGIERTYRLIDTAGLRRRSKVQEKVESLSAGETIRAIRFAQIVVLVLDADAVLDRQDLTIARRVIDEGRALLIVVNKWDAAQDRRATMERLTDRLETSLPQVKGIPVITCSALTGKGLDQLLPAVEDLYQAWNQRVSTAKLNRWLMAATEAHPPPIGKGGKRIRLRYATQAKTRPPTFAMFSNRAAELPDSYTRYLVNSLREDFDLWGIPIRLNMRAGKNPYAKDAG